MSPSELTQQSAVASPRSPSIVARQVRVRPKNSCSSGRSWPIADGSRRFHSAHGPLRRQRVHGGRRRVDLLRAALEVLLAAVAHVPVAADRHHAELGVERQVGGPADAEHHAAELGRRRLRPAALEQRPPHPEPGVRRRHPQLGQLVHRAEAGDAGVADHLVVVLADHERAVGLGDDELEQAALALPAGVEVVARALGARGGSRPRSLREASRAASPSSNVARRSLARPSRKERTLTRDLLARVLERRRVAELAELRRGAPEHQADGPVDGQPHLARDAGHHRQVVGARREPGREAAQAQPRIVATALCWPMSTNTPSVR